MTDCPLCGHSDPLLAPAASPIVYLCENCSHSWTEDDDNLPLTFAYEDLRHEYDGIKVECPNCHAHPFLKNLAKFGCHECDVGPVAVTIEAQDG